MVLGVWGFPECSLLGHLPVKKHLPESWGAAGQAAVIPPCSRTGLGQRGPVCSLQRCLSPAPAGTPCLGTV